LVLSFFNQSDKFISEGIVEVKKNLIIIKELPLKKWTEDYKNYLISQHVKFSEHHSENEVEFRIKVEEGQEEAMQWKLETSFSLNNMTLFDSNKKIRKYERVNDILTEFFGVRLNFYKKRRENNLEKWSQELKKYREKLHFLKIHKELDLNQKTKEEIIEIMKRLNFISIQELLNIPILNLTKDNLTKLESLIFEKEEKYQLLLKQNEKDLWRMDLLNLKKALELK
jgi:DNA topoisomerase II